MNRMSISLSLSISLSFSISLSLSLFLTHTHTLKLMLNPGKKFEPCARSISSSEKIQDGRLADEGLQGFPLHLHPLNAHTKLIAAGKYTLLLLLHVQQHFIVNTCMHIYVCTYTIIHT